MGKKYKDSDILKAMAYHLDESSVVYGANGHYSVGAYYDILGDDYNKQEVLDAASGATAVEEWASEEIVDEDLKKALWID